MTFKIQCLHRIIIFYNNICKTNRKESLLLFSLSKIYRGEL